MSSAAHDVLFLCSGNVLRSAFCELYARHLELPLNVTSGATLYRNSALFPESRIALLDRGVDPNWLDAFRPTHIDRLSPREGSRVFGMTNEHLRAFEAHFGSSFELALTSTLTGSHDEIDDPLHTGRYTATFERLAACVEALE